MSRENLLPSRGRRFWIALCIAVLCVSLTGIYVRTHRSHQEHKLQQRARISGWKGLGASQRDVQKVLFSACDTGKAGDVAVFLKIDPALVKARDRLGGTPLHHAAEFGHPGVVAVLLESGADINARQSLTGSTPLMVAVMVNKTEMIRQLIAAGADLNLFDKDNKTALYYATASLSMVKLLVEAGADVNACKPGGETPLADLEHSKDWSKADRKKPTYKAIVKYLKEHGAKMKCNPGAK